MKGVRPDLKYKFFVNACSNVLVKDFKKGKTNQYLQNSVYFEVVSGKPLLFHSIN